MEQLDDSALLGFYVDEQSDDAFAALVTRHLNLVYSVAMRQTGSPEAAEEISQAVFIIVARKAIELRRHQSLSSWLFQATRLTAANYRRSENRRRNREQEAYMQSALDESADDTSLRIARLLDNAVASLRERDRRAILLRFYEGRSLREVGTALQSTEAAAEKTVSRALEKLRRFFAKRGVSSTTAIISGAISSPLVQVAPAALVKSITASAIGKGAAASSTLTLVQGALKLMAWTKAKTAIVAAACVLFTVGMVTTTVLFNREKPIHGFPPGWSVLDGNGQWQVIGGRINAHTTGGDSMLASREEYSDVTFSAIVSSANREASLGVRLQDENNGYIVVFAPSGRPAPSGPAPGSISVIKRIAGNETTLASYQKRTVPAIGERAKINVTTKGPSIEVSLNGSTILRAQDTTFSKGYIGFRIYGWEDYPCDATFANVIFH